MDCVFCKIVKGEIPCHKVYEDDTTLAFLDVKPHAKGHTMVIPKRHGETMFDVDESISMAVMGATIKVMQKIQDVLQPDGFNVGWNHNTAGGQVVPHLHVHIMPRYMGDGGGSQHSIVDHPGEISVDKVATLFR
jgi:histidine triad (HIT) family protein